MKYIVISVTMPAQRDNTGQPAGDPWTYRYPFIFPDSAVHADVAEAMVLMYRKQFKEAVSIEASSAGDLSSFGFSGKCEGMSTTLMLTSDTSDTNLIRLSDYGSSTSIGQEGDCRIPIPPGPWIETYVGFTLTRVPLSGKLKRWTAVREHSNPEERVALSHLSKTRLKALIYEFTEQEAKS